MIEIYLIASFQSNDNIIALSFTVCKGFFVFLSYVVWGKDATNVVIVCIIQGIPNRQQEPAH